MKLPRPLAGRAGAARIYLLDCSVDGIRIAHQGGIPAVGQPCRVSFEWDGQPIELDCEVMNNYLARLAKTKDEKSTYHAGLHIKNGVGESRNIMRAMIADVVARALDEQKANARGIPATAVQSFQTGKGTDFVRCELIDGTWRRTMTQRPEQPPNGFTVSVDEEEDQVDMLCETFANSDAEGRKLIQTLAELSISKSEGVPTRRYTP